MKERPILFSGPMVRALLAGTKTQTRRIIKPQPQDSIDALHGSGFRNRAPYVLRDRETDAPTGYGFADETRDWRSPYGQPGDRLWVRETWATTPDGKGFLYRADDPNHLFCSNPGRAWKPSIFCKREASRLTLEVTGIRVERLNDISEADAMAEGVTIMADAEITSEFIRWEKGPAQLEYWALWESINGKGSWLPNPWVWVVEFKVLGVENDQALPTPAATSTTR